VPKLKGKTLAAAKTAIRTHHCAVGKVTRVNVPKRLLHHVLSQRPRPGRHLRRGSKIALKVGR
jgi:beta-lactam-binding protein with PASTA domain